MIIETYLFKLFSLLLIINSLMVVLSKNTIYSVLFLILSFLISSCILILLECDFLSLTFLIIYVGAISILFLFVVMMLNIKITNSSKDIFKYLPIGNLIGGILLFEIILYIYKFFENNHYFESINTNNEVSPYLYFFKDSYTNYFEKIDFLTNVEVIGQVLYTLYVVQFLLAGIILVVAVIGVVVLTVENNNSNLHNKNQIMFKQLSRSFKKTI